MCVCVHAISIIFIEYSLSLVLLLCLLFITCLTFSSLEKRGRDERKMIKTSETNWGLAKIDGAPRKKFFYNNFLNKISQINLIFFATYHNYVFDEQCVIWI